VALGIAQKIAPIVTARRFCCGGVTSATWRASTRVAHHAVWHQGAARASKIRQTSVNRWRRHGIVAAAAVAGGAADSAKTRKIACVLAAV
jgi:hypothetical protein